MLRRDAKFQSANGTADKYCSRAHGLGVVVAVTALVVVYCRIGEEFIGMLDRHIPPPPSIGYLSFSLQQTLVFPCTCGFFLWPRSFECFTIYLPTYLLLSCTATLVDLVLH